MSENRCFKIRWLAFTLGIVMAVTACIKGDVRNLIIAFVIGMPLGLLVDFIGVKFIPLWTYRNGCFGRDYFQVIIPCWGIYSVVINLLWDWIKNPWLAFPVVTIGLFACSELPNLKTKSWIYSVPLWFVVIGWIPLVLSFRRIYSLF